MSSPTFKTTAHNYPKERNIKPLYQDKHMGTLSGVGTSMCTGHSTFNCAHDKYIICPNAEKLISLERTLFVFIVIDVFCTDIYYTSYYLKLLKSSQIWPNLGSTHNSKPYGQRYCSIKLKNIVNSMFCVVDVILHSFRF
jgi:hypothetical protein